MAFCANCGANISDQATACPTCGHLTGVGSAPAAGNGALAYPLASIGSRVIALLIDGLITGGVGLVLSRGTYGLGGAIGFLYNWLMIAYNDGRTVGKMVMGIRIARPDGSAVDVGTAAARAGMGIISGLACGLGYLWAFWDAERRTWHDSVANTRAFAQPR